MAFVENNFSPVGGLHGPDREDNSTGISMFSYITPDTLAVVKTLGYFDALRDRVFQGDVIHLGSTQLDDDSSDNEYTLIYFMNVPRSPSAIGVSMNPKDINAS